MKVTWYGTASLRLETIGGKVLIDPFVRSYGGMDERILNAFRKEKTVLITHGHFDHISHMSRIFGKKKDIAVYATKTPIRILTQDGMESEVFHEIRCEENMQINGFDVRAWQGKHIRYDSTLVLKTLFSRRIFKYFPDFIKGMKQWVHYVENGETLLWELQAEGKCILIMGSAGIEEGISYPSGADLLLLAYQGRSDMVTYVQGIINKLKPKCIMPIHFDDSFPPFSTEVDMKCFEEMMCKQFPNIGMMIPQLDVTYEI